MIRVASRARQSTGAEGSKHGAHCLHCVTFTACAGDAAAMPVLPLRLLPTLLLHVPATPRCQRAPASPFSASEPPRDSTVLLLHTAPALCPVTLKDSYFAFLANLEFTSLLLPVLLTPVSASTPCPSRHPCRAGQPAPCESAGNSAGVMEGGSSSSPSLCASAIKESGSSAVCALC